MKSSADLALVKKTQCAKLKRNFRSIIISDTNYICYGKLFLGTERLNIALIIFTVNKLIQLPTHSAVGMEVCSALKESLRKHP